MLNAGCGEVIDELDFVGGCQLLDSFDFYDEGVVDDEIRFELSDDFLMVMNSEFFLGFKVSPA